MTTTSQEPGLGESLGLQDFSGAVNAEVTAPVGGVAMRLPPAWASVPAEDHPWRRYLPHIERMAAQQMSEEHIAARLGIGLGTLREARTMYADVDAAFAGGAARGVDEVSEMMLARARGGDVNAGKFHLQTAGYNRPGPAGAVTVNMPSGGQQLVSVSVASIDSMANRPASCSSAWSALLKP